MMLYVPQVWKAALMLAVVAGGASTHALAQSRAGGASSSTPPASASPAAETAETVLARAREAVKGVRAFRYAAFVENLAEPGATMTGDVFGRRIDGGGWQLGARGSAIATPSSAARAFEIGYDGLTARSIRVDEKTVDDRSLEKPQDVRAFFAGQDVLHPVAWEMLDDEKELGAGMTPTLLAPTTIAGQACEVVELSPSIDTKQAGSGRVRVAIAKQDNLPRRIERVRVDESGRVVSGRSLELRGLKVNQEAAMGPFTLDVPDGYRVRTKDTSAMRARATADDLGSTTPAAEPVAGWPHNPELLAQGSSAPAFALKDAEGVERTLASYKGKVVVMDFWATWCGPCRIAMPALQRLHEKYKDKPVVILGMNAEGGGDGDPVQFKKDKGYTYPLLLKADAISDRYRVQGLPTFYVISGDGAIVWGGIGLEGPAGVARPTPKDYETHLEATLTALIDRELDKLAKTPAPKESAQAPKAGAKEKANATPAKRASAPWPHDERLLAIGTPAPSFTLKDTKGATHALQDYRGKVVVLDFWATWCPPCRVALPAIDKLHTKYKDNDKVVILGMNAQRGRPGNAGAFLREKGLDFTTLLDAEELRGPYQSPGIPTFYVIDPQGNIAWGGVGLMAAGGTSKPDDSDYRDFLLETLSAHIEKQLAAMKK